MSSLHFQIVQWITDHGDAEFRLSDDAPDEAERDWRLAAKPAIFTPKPRSVTSRFIDAEVQSRIGVIGTNGVATGDRRRWLQESLADKDVGFIGDLDAPDLMAYAALNYDLISGGLKYLGISDDLLARFSVPLESLERCFIPMTAPEQAGIEALAEMGFSLETLVGSGCLSVLESGKKIEIEGLFWSISVEQIVSYIENG